MKQEMLSIILFILLLPFLGLTQSKKDLKDKIEARKVAFITTHLELTPAEAQTFWPLYNEFYKDKKQLNKTYKTNAKFTLLSDEELEKHIDRQLEKEEKALALKKGYIKKLKMVLPVRKIAMLPRIENKFKQMILQRIKDRKKKN